MIKAPKLTDAQAAVLAKLYAECELPLDKLPYTPEFSALWRSLACETGLDLTNSQLWLALCNLRKAKKLVSKVRPAKPKANPADPT